MDTNLKFSDKETTSELDKKVDGELDIVEKELKKEADFYDKTLFTLSPEGHDPSLGIFPQDQTLAPNHVLIWADWKTIPPSYLDKEYVIYQFKIPSESFVKQHLRNLGGGVYAVKYLSNDIKFEKFIR